MGYNLLYFKNIRNTDVPFVIQTAPTFLDRKPQIQLSSRALQLRRLTQKATDHPSLCSFPNLIHTSCWIPRCPNHSFLQNPSFSPPCYSHVYGHTRVIFGTTQTAVSFCKNFGIPCTNINHYPANVENMVSYISK